MRTALDTTSNIVESYRNDFGKAALEIVVDLSDSDLRGAVVEGLAIRSLAGSDVSGATLNNVDLRMTNFAKTVADDTTCIEAADLSKTKVPDVSFGHPFICDPHKPAPGVLNAWHTGGFVKGSTWDRCG